MSLLCLGCTCLVLVPSVHPIPPLHLFCIFLVRLTACCIELHAVADLHDMTHLLRATNYPKHVCRVVMALALAQSDRKVWLRHPCRGAMSANMMGGHLRTFKLFRKLYKYCPGQSTFRPVQPMPPHLPNQICRALESLHLVNTAGMLSRF